MATPDDYRKGAGYRFSAASGAMIAANPATAVALMPVSIAPIHEASPEDASEPPTQGMVSRSADATWIPGAWLKALKANDDTILRREGGQGLKLYDQLLDDDQAFSALQQRRLAITSRDWEVAPGDDKDPRSVRAADDVRAMLKTVGFDRITTLLHYAVWYGYGVAEAIWTTKVQDGRSIVWLDDVVVPDRRYFGFTAEGELRNLQTACGLGNGGEVPPNKFCTIRTGGTHDFAFYGLGLAHWCYWPIFFKRSALKFWALYLEKFGMPTVGIEMTDAQATDPREQGKLINAAVAVGQDRAVLLPVGTLSQDRLQLIEAERSGSGASSYKDFVSMQDESVMRIVLGQPGTSKGVSSGLNSDQADVHADVKAEIVKADSDLISEGLNRTFLKWVTLWNYGEDVAPPTVYRVLDDAEDMGAVATRDATLDGIGIKRTEDSVHEVYGDGYVLDRMSEQDKADQAAKLAQRSQVLPGEKPDAVNLAFGATEEDAISRLIDALVEEANPVFTAMADELRGSLQGVTTIEGVRVALLSAMERMPVERLAQMTALPMLAERAAAGIGLDASVRA